jgi:tetratricopeptide (TPR) repeat protein
MKNLRLIVITILILFSITLISLRSDENSGKPLPVPVALPITLCGSMQADWADTTLVQTKLLPGLGNLHFEIRTVSPKAQEFFNQGLRLVYGFNHWEAIQAFRQAAKLDPECAMAYWGLALAYGPNLNDINPVDREKIAYEAIQKALGKKTKAAASEHDIIDAMATRYNGKAYASRDSLNKTYAEAMIALSKKYPDHPEIQTLCADAIMNTMPWDYWLKDGSPKPATQQAKIILESLIRKFPQHPGAHHLYIHLVEASPEPGQGIASAQFLENAMPGAGHIVHMPAHIYLRVGLYEKSIQSNQRAVMVDEEYLSGSQNKGMYRWSYYPHNVDFISFSSYMEGRSDLGIKTAMKLAYKGSLITTSNPVFAQYFISEPLYAFVRFGKWNDILSLPDPDKNFIYANVISHFAKGLASLRTNDLRQAQTDLTKLDSLCKLDTLGSVYFSFNPVSEIVKVPLHILKGELLIRQNKISEGINSLKNAVEAEDNLRYMEPPDWKLPARQYLGAALYETGNYAEAEKVYVEDLRKYPENGWSLKGLWLCQTKLGKKAAADQTSIQFTKAWKNSDVQLQASRF